MLLRLYTFQYYRQCLFSIRRPIYRSFFSVITLVINLCFYKMDLFISMIKKQCILWLDMEISNMWLTRLLKLLIQSYLNLNTIGLGLLGASPLTGELHSYFSKDYKFLQNTCHVYYYCLTC